MTVAPSGTAIGLSGTARSRVPARRQRETASARACGRRSRGCRAVPTARQARPSEASGSRREDGITVTAVCPALTRTAILPPEMLDQALPVVQHGQAIKCEGATTEVVGLIAFLISDEADFITGQFIAADGGLTRL
jgi:hypothetical protein